MVIRGPLALLLLAWSHLATAQLPPDPADPCADNPDLTTGGCNFWDVATVYAYTGDTREFEWTPCDEDLYRRDRMFYFVEVRTWPLDSIVIALQTAPGEETTFWTPNALGHYHLRVRACDPQLIPSGDPNDLIPSEHCSDWSDSMNDVNTPPNVPGWVVYVDLKPGTGGGIE
jgi:hypothetical protein